MKCIIPQPEMTASEEEKLRAQAIKKNDKILNYADYSLCLSLHRNAGFGRDRFARYNAEVYKLGRHYVTRYGTDDKDDEEYAVNSYYALVRDLRGWGWDPEENLWQEAVFDTFPPEYNSAAMREKHAIRLGYAKGISFYVREMLCMAALWLREEHGWAQIRLGRVMRPVADGYLSLMRDYLRCTKDGDAAVTKRINVARREYNEMGFFDVAY